VCRWRTARGLFAGGEYAEFLTGVEGQVVEGDPPRCPVHDAGGFGDVWVIGPAERLEPQILELRDDHLGGHAVLQRERQHDGEGVHQATRSQRAASRITDVAPLLVPGLLQTADYARAVLGEGPDIQRRVDLRVERAEILTRPRNPAALRAFVHTEALARPVAPAEVMRAQMRHLLRMAELPNVIIQTVTGYARWWMPSLANPFILIEFPEATPIVHIEHYRGGAFVWEIQEVRSYAAAADEITQRAMTPTQAAEVIAEMEKTL